MSGSTNDDGNSPILPVRACVPLYQPLSRFLCTQTMSPSCSSSSNSLFGGYDTMHRNLKTKTDENSIMKNDLAGKRKVSTLTSPWAHCYVYSCWRHPVLMLLDCGQFERKSWQHPNSAICDDGTMNSLRTNDVTNFYCILDYGAHSCDRRLLHSDADSTQSCCVF